ncbi:hypothetical protein FQY83_14665 [Luteimonas marina]|uniref:Uncharacterized protein n=1 Tax=Luteimonas marina TaxID=488485 RepID=A0A5C5TXZ7_9GAMM|nr:hypothetical protein [Luteimonas marina]TWT18616.1 hypothetical protein FQY83_14665 [Luteimonas marina]
MLMVQRRGNRPGNGGAGHRRRMRGCLPVLALLVLAGCGDEVAQEARERDRAAQQAAAPAPAAGLPPQAQSPMRFEITSSSGVEVAAAAVDFRCVDGKAASAEVQVDWKVAIPGVTAVRIKVVAEGVQDKTWTEAGGTGQATTGPWVNDGMRLRLEALSDGSVLGEVRAVAGPCT